MLKKLAWIAAIAFLYSCSNDEPVVYVRSESESFTTPEELASLNGVTDFVGDLKINSRSISSLEELKSLRRIDGNLLISLNEELTSLSGLENLRSVNGIELFANEKLADISALRGIATLELLKLKNLPELTTIDDLGAITITGSVLISFVPQLEEITNLTIQDGKAFNLFLSNNSRLERVDFLSQVRETTWLWLSKNPVLELNGSLDHLEQVEHLHLEQLPLLEALELTQLTDFEDVWITDNDNLLNIRLDGDELIQFESFEDPEITIANQPQLHTIEGFNGHTKAIINIFQNEALRSISGFDNVSLLWLTMRENPQLQSLDLFSEAEVQVEELHFFANGLLSDFCGLNQVLQSDLSSAAIYFQENDYNPTADMLTDGKCSAD